MSVVPYRPLGHIRDIVAELGLEVTYCYEDLVYIEHNAFLLRMGEQGDEVHLYFNTESDAGEREAIALNLQSAGLNRQINVTRSGTYTMTPLPDSANIQIAFHEGQL
jgi:hypothetical protein